MSKGKVETKEPSVEEQLEEAKQKIARLEAPDAIDKGIEKFGKLMQVVNETDGTSFVFGDKEIGFKKKTVYSGKSDTQSIQQCVYENMGEDAAVSVRNNASVASNFIGGKGVSPWKPVATWASIVVTGTAAFLGGKAKGAKASASSDSNVHNINDGGNASYDHLNFG